MLLIGGKHVDYRKLVESIPVEKWEMLSNKLIGFILTSKNDETNKKGNGILKEESKPWLSLE